MYLILAQLTPTSTTYTIATYKSWSVMAQTFLAASCKSFETKQLYASVSCYV